MDGPLTSGHSHREMHDMTDYLFIIRTSTESAITIIYLPVNCVPVMLDTMQRPGTRIQPAMIDLLEHISDPIWSNLR